MLTIKNLFKQESPTEINSEFRVKKILSSGVIIKLKQTNILVYTHNHYRINDLISVRGIVEKPTNFADFDYVGYLKTLNIENSMRNSDIKLLGHSNDIRSIAREYLTTGPGDYKRVAPLIILGQKTIESKELYELSIKLSIVHLFVISGFHISLFYIILTKFFKFIKVKDLIALPISLLVLFIYIFLMDFPTSATRAFCLTFFGIVNKKIFKQKFSKLQVLAFILALFSIYKPWNITSLSFIFTFIATGVIIFMNEFEYKSDFKKIISISLCVYAATIIISMNINKYISIFGILFGFVLTPVFSIMFTISIFLFPFKEQITVIYSYFIFLLKSLDSINIIINVPGFGIDEVKLIYGSMLSCLIIIKI